MSDPLPSIPRVGETEPETDSIRVAWTGVDARRHRLTIQPRDAGGYVRVEEVEIAGDWHPQGREIVSDVSFESV